LGFEAASSFARLSNIYRSELILLKEVRPSRKRSEKAIIAEIQGRAIEVIITGLAPVK